MKRLLSFMLLLTLLVSNSLWAMQGTDWIATGTGGGTSTGNDTSGTTDSGSGSAGNADTTTR